jgi:hypothetical protein
MKTTFLLFLLLGALTSVLYSGCEPVADNTTGDPRDQYVGKWLFNEDLKSTEGQSFIVVISKDPDNSSQVILKNFVYSGEDVIVYGLVTSGQIVVSTQKMSNGWTVEGSGVINKAKTSMSWDYNLLIAVDWEHHLATALLQ